MRQRGRAGRWFAVAAALLAVVVVSGCGGPPRSSGSGVFTVEIVTHVVSEGETLASIADDYYGDPSGASYLAGVNGVDDAFQLNPGMLVEVPVGEEDIARYAVRTDAKARYNRGIAFATTGELRKAADEFGAALKQDPRFADAGYNLGVVLLMMGEPEASARVLEQVIEVRAGRLPGICPGQSLLRRGKSGRRHRAFRCRDRTRSGTRGCGIRPGSCAPRIGGD